MTFKEQKKWLNDNGFIKMPYDSEYAYQVQKELVEERMLQVWRMAWSKLWFVGIEDLDSENCETVIVFYTLPTDLDFNTLQPIFEMMNYRQTVYGK